MRDIAGVRVTCSFLSDVYTIFHMLTGQSDLSGVLKVRTIEAIGRLVRKPWDPEELKGLVRELLRQGPRQDVGIKSTRRLS